MTRMQLEQQRAGIEAQMRWAFLHDGDEELVDLLRSEIERISAKIADQTGGRLGILANLWQPIIASLS